MDEMDDVLLPKPEPEDSPAKPKIKEERRAAGNLDVIKKVEDIVRQRSPYIIAKYREVMNSTGPVSQGMTRKEINNKYQVVIVGDENYAQMRMKAGQVNTLRNEATSFLRELEAKHVEAISHIESIKLIIDREIVISNQAVGRADRISDKAREALTNQILTLDSIGTDLAHVNSEITIWKSVVRDLDKTLETIETNLQSLASENKYDAFYRSRPADVSQGDR